jgi:hypothetical protein
MKDCGDHNVNSRLYLDNELSGPDLENFLTHLKECVACRKTLSAEAELTSLLRRQRPIYSASETLRSRVKSTLVDPLPTNKPAPIGWRTRILRLFARPCAAGTPCWRAQAAVVLLLIAGPLLLPKFLQRCRAAD